MIWKSKCISQALESSPSFSSRLTKAVISRRAIHFCSFIPIPWGTPPLIARDYGDYLSPRIHFKFTANSSPSSSLIVIVIIFLNSTRRGRALFERLEIHDHKMSPQKRGTFCRLSAISSLRCLNQDFIIIMKTCNIFGVIGERAQLRMALR